MKLLDLNIDFPEIEGVSDRQIQYAENLRELYVVENEDRFREIEEIVEEELDYRIRNNFDGLTETYFEEFNDYERCCLFGIDAGGIISTLKKQRFHG